MAFVGRQWWLPGGMDKDPTLILESLAGPTCHGQRFPEGHRKSKVTLRKEMTTETPLTSGSAQLLPRLSPCLVPMLADFKDTRSCPPPDTGPATGTLHPTNEQVHVQLRHDYHHLVQLRKVKTPLTMCVSPAVFFAISRSCHRGSWVLCHLPSLKLCVGRRGYLVSPAPWHTWQILGKFEPLSF